MACLPYASSNTDRDVCHKENAPATPSLRRPAPHTPTSMLAGRINSTVFLQVHRPPTWVMLSTVTDLLPRTCSLTPPASIQAASRAIYSLFRVLFNFPSRYLSTIGFVQVFSLGWSLPPTLDSILKLSDSKVNATGDRQYATRFIRTGLSPALGKVQSHNLCWTSNKPTTPGRHLNTTLPCPQT